jgi:type VI protein secretion system component VasK
MIDQALSINWTVVLMIMGYIIGAYIVLCVLVGVFRGWNAVLKIFHWTRKLWWVFAIIIGLIIAAYSMRGKKKRQDEISGKIGELEKIDNKTQEDQRKLIELQNERKRIEQEILDKQRQYEKKLEELKKKPPSDPKDPSKDPKPGDAGASSDGLTNTW